MDLLTISPNLLQGYRHLQRVIPRTLWMIFLGILLWCGPLDATKAYGAYGFGPHQYETAQQYGQGIYFAPYLTKIYAEPGEDASVIETLQWQPGAQSLSVFSQSKQVNVSARNAFICFYPELDVAMMSVIGENGEGWAEVVYDQAQGKTGWVQLKESKATKSPMAMPPVEEGVPSHLGRFQSWLQFMRMNARHHGIYWMDGVDSYFRNIRTKPEDTAAFVKTTYIKNIKVLHVRGNWLLVEARDFGNHHPIGWIRWRDDEGKLMVFTDFTGEYKPVTTISF